MYRGDISVKFHFTDLAPCSPSRAASPSKVSEIKFLILFDCNVTPGNIEKITISVFFWFWREHTRENI